MIEMAPWGDDSETIEKQILNHNKSHSSIQRSQEVDRAREELVSDNPVMKLFQSDWTGFFIHIVY